MIIITAIFVFRNPVTGLGVLGSSIAILGLAPQMHRDADAEGTREIRGGGGGEWGGTLIYSLAKNKYAKPLRLFGQRGGGVGLGRFRPSSFGPPARRPETSQVKPETRAQPSFEQPLAQSFPCQCQVISPSPPLRTSWSHFSQVL